MLNVNNEKTIFPFTFWSIGKKEVSVDASIFCKITGIGCHWVHFWECFQDYVGILHDRWGSAAHRLTCWGLRRPPVNWNRCTIGTIKSFRVFYLRIVVLTEEVFFAPQNVSFVATVNQMLKLVGQIRWRNDGCKTIFDWPWLLAYRS